MNRERTANLLAAAGLACAIAALLFVSFWPGMYQHESVSLTQSGARVVERSSSSIVEENGLGVLWVLAIPAMLALAAFALSFWRSMAGTWLMFALASVMLLYAFVAMFSVGMFYVPVMLLMLIAAFAHARTRRAT